MTDPDIDDAREEDEVRATYAVHDLLDAQRGTEESYEARKRRLIDEALALRAALENVERAAQALDVAGPSQTENADKLVRTAIALRAVVKRERERLESVMRLRAEEKVSRQAVLDDMVKLPGGVASPALVVPHQPGRKPALPKQSDPEHAAPEPRQPNHEHGAGFGITAHKGVQMGFANGWTVSIQWGPGNYCEKYHERFEAPQAAEFWTSADGEIAVYRDGETGMVRLGHDEVVGHVKPEKVALVLHAVAVLPATFTHQDASGVLEALLFTKGAEE